MPRSCGARPTSSPADADVIVDEPGAPTHLTLRLAPKDGSTAIAFRVDSDVADLEKVPQLRRTASGAFRISAAGEVDSTKKAVDARLRAQAAGIARGTTHLQSASLEARARGPLDAPEVDATVHARGILAGGLRFVSADVVARGNAMSPHVAASARGPDTPDIDATADVGLRGGVSLGALRVALARASERALVTARKVMVGGGDVTVDDARVEGLGAPLTATVRKTPATMTVRAATQGLDLARVARLAHLENILQGGTLALDTDVHLRRTAAEGRLRLDAKHVGAAKARDVSAHVELSLEGRKVTGKVHGEVPGAATLDVDASGVGLGGAGALTSATWKQAFGSVDVERARRPGQARRRSCRARICRLARPTATSSSTCTPDETASTTRLRPSSSR